MGILAEAKQRELTGYGFNATRSKVIWTSSKCAWNWIMICWGIRRSDLIQIFPIWNMSNNAERSLLFGFWKFYFEIKYHRKHGFNQDRLLPFRHTMLKTYQLFF